MRSALGAVLVATLGACAPAGAADLGSQWSPPAHADPRDAGGPLDVVRVGFGQRDLRLKLKIRTHEAWRLRDLRGNRSLCVVTRAGSLCLGSGSSGALVRFDGRIVPAAVTRPDTRSVRVSLAPRAIGVPPGPLAWHVEARWAGEDRVPDTGEHTSAVSVLAQPRCFAAAARDPRRPCRNASLRTTVYPRPAAAYLWPNSPCRPLPGSGDFDPCGFGVRRGARRTVALIGDSHAVHWRAALEVVAQARNWRGVSITRPGCPFSTQIPSSPALGPAACAQLHRDTLAWLRAHPEVRTIFVSNWAEPPWGPHGGTGGYGGGPAAFAAMLDRVPRSVRRIHVLRDIPATLLRSTACVDARRRAGRSLDGACSAARADVLTPDPGAAAALARRPRARVIDLTRHFCGPARCYPVVGGAYVYKDGAHMNAVFSTSLGPFVLRALRRAGQTIR